MIGVSSKQSMQVTHGQYMACHQSRTKHSGKRDWVQGPVGRVEDQKMSGYLVVSSMGLISTLEFSDRKSAKYIVKCTLGIETNLSCIGAAGRGNNGFVWQGGVL